MLLKPAHLAQALDNGYVIKQVPPMAQITPGVKLTDTYATPDKLGVFLGALEHE
jgi:hypothetical protein